MNHLYRFNQVFKQTNLIYYTYAKQNHLSLTDFWKFYYLRLENKPLTQSELQLYLLVPKQTVHSSIRKLEEEGYLTLKSGKGRNMHIYLTDAGKQLIEQKLYPVHHLESDAFSVMTEEECQKMLELYSKYITAMRAGLPRIQEDL